MRQAGRHSSKLSHYHYLNCQPEKSKGDLPKPEKQILFLRKYQARSCSSIGLSNTYFVTSVRCHSTGWLGVMTMTHAAECLLEY
jgi:hypothetical protein